MEALGRDGLASGNSGWPDIKPKICPFLYFAAPMGIFWVVSRLQRALPAVSLSLGLLAAMIVVQWWRWLGWKLPGLGGRWWESCWHDCTLALGSTSLAALSARVVVSGGGSRLGSVRGSPSSTPLVLEVAERVLRR